jgi:hypothetical protein
MIVWHIEREGFEWYRFRGVYCTLRDEVFMRDRMVQVCNKGYVGHRLSSPVGARMMTSVVVLGSSRLPSILGEEAA